MPSLVRRCQSAPNLLSPRNLGLFSWSQLLVPQSRFRSVPPSTASFHFGGVKHQLCQENIIERRTARQGTKRWSAGGRGQASWTDIGVIKEQGRRLESQGKHRFLICSATGSPQGAANGGAVVKYDPQFMPHGDSTQQAMLLL